MRHTILPAALIGALIVLAFYAHADEKKPEPASVYGRIELVKSFPDFKVKAVSSFPDLKVKIVKSLPGMGEWQIVESFPDYKVQLVDSFPDFTVEFSGELPQEKK